MDRIEKWIKENCTGSERRNFNGIDYRFCEMNDKWIAVFEILKNGEYRPLIQAKDMSHAEDFCSMREPLPSYVQVI